MKMKHPGIFTVVLSLGLIALAVVALYILGITS